jgi:hypothetical protein
MNGVLSGRAPPAETQAFFYATRLNPCDNFRRVEGFDYVIIRAEPQTHKFIDILIESGNHNDGDSAFMAKRGKHAPAVTRAKVNVQQDEIRFMEAIERYRLLPDGPEHYAIPRLRGYRFRLPGTS